jgi:iron complex transport system substrate-binding protein
MDKTEKIAVILILCCAAAGTAALVMGMAWTGEHPSALAGAPPVSATGGAVSALDATAPANTTSCAPVTINQTDGTPITLPCKAERLIVANSDAAEMLIAFGAADKIVGVDESTFSVPYIMNKIPNATSIGNWETPNIEQILALHPDAVISYSSYKPKNIDQITAANITVISLDCYQLSTLASDARAIGTLTGTSDTADDYAQMVNGTINQVNARVKTLPADEIPSVYFEGYTDYTAESNGSGSNELLVAAGGRNIAGNSSTSYMTVSPEWLVAQQPQYVMKVVASSDNRKLTDVVATLRARTGWSTIPAVQQNHVNAFDSDLAYGPRAYIGLVYMAQILHPNTFPDMNPREMLDAYAGQYVNGTNVSRMMYP